jgi:hypothetical protein
MFRYPSLHKLAEYHQRANRLGYSAEWVTHQGKQRKAPPCPCCERIINSSEVPLCYSTCMREPRLGEPKEILPLGVNIYFSFLKMFILLLLLRFIVFDINVIVSSSLYGDYCSQVALDSTSLKCSVTISGYNLNSPTNQERLKTVDILGLVYVLLAMCYFIVFRKILHNFRKYARGKDFIDNNFTILVEHVPSFFYEPGKTRMEDVNYNYKKLLQQRFEREIHAWTDSIEEKRNTTSLEPLENFYVEDVLLNRELSKRERKLVVTGINICYNLNEISNIDLIREQMLAEEAKGEQEEGKGEGEPEDEKRRLLEQIPNRITILNHEYVRLCEHFTFANSSIAAFKLTHFTGRAFISFQFEHYKEYIVRKYEDDHSAFKISGQPIKISEASRPKDIYWYNMKVTDANRKSYMCYSWAVLFMLLVLCFAVLLGTEFWKRTITPIDLNQNLQSQAKSIALTVFMALVTTIINAILSNSMVLLSVMEKHQTKTRRLKSLILKTIITQTINTVFIYGIVYIIQPSGNILSTQGLGPQITGLVLVSGIVNIIVEFLIPA